MDDIAAVGLPRHPAARRSVRAVRRSTGGADARLLAAHQLTFVALSSGNLSIDPAREQEELATARAPRASSCATPAGSSCRSSTSVRRGARSSRDDYRRLGTLLTELGKRTADLGVPLVYHHHMNSLGEKPEEVARRARRRRSQVRAPPVRHRALPAGRRRSGRGDSQVSRLDRRAAPQGCAPAAGPACVASAPASAYQFVELGRGRVDLPGVFAALARDQVRRAGRSSSSIACPIPAARRRQSAEINKRYLVEKVHQTI